MFIILKTEMFGSCLAVLIFAALYECLKSFREHLLLKALIQRNHDYVRPVPSDDIQVAIAGQKGTSA